VCAEGEIAFGMPEPDLVSSRADGKCFHCYEVTADQPTASIERYAQAKAAEVERLRESLETLRPKVLQHDPEYNGQRTNGPMPKWNGMLKMIDNALAARKEKECE